MSHVASKLERGIPSTPLRLFIALFALVAARHFKRLLLAILLAVAVQSASADTVTITITGTVASGTDTTGVFGAQNANLKGKPYKLVFTFDDSMGAPLSTTIKSGVQTQGTSNPGTAVLYIGNGAFSIGGSTKPYSMVYADVNGAAGGTFYEVTASDGVYLQGSDIQGTITPATGTTLGLKSSWEDSFTNSNLYESPSAQYSLSFLIDTGYDSQSRTNQYIASGNLSASTITVSGAWPSPPGSKTLGDDGDPAKKPGQSLSTCGCTGKPSKDGRFSAGEPIEIATGDVFYKATDYSTFGENPLQFIRFYNSLGSSTGLEPLSTSLGNNWSSNYDRFLRIGPTSVVAERPDGRQISFMQKSGQWQTDPDIDVTLTQSGSQWILTDHDDTVETYDQATGTFFDLAITFGRLSSIASRNGYIQTLIRTPSGVLQSVTDNYHRHLDFSYTSAGFLSTVTTPDGLVITYTVTNISGAGNRLTNLAYNTSPVTGQTFNYALPNFPFLMTSLTDENGNALWSWTYDFSGRGTSSRQPGGANLTSVAYNLDGSVVVTNPTGVTDTYTSITSQNMPKVSTIVRAATSDTDAATEKFTYDSNGYLNSGQDWNGNTTSYNNNSHGDPIFIDEAVGTAVERKTTIIYDPVWVHLPHEIDEADRVTIFTYDTVGEETSRVITDKTTATVPYSTNGLSREWKKTWSNALLESVETPKHNKTQFEHAGDGSLTSITDPVGNKTKIDSHMPGGLPLTILDPNGVTTTLEYTPRLWLKSSTVSGPDGSFQTAWDYDADGSVTLTTLPDKSFVKKTYDQAQRLTDVVDALGNDIHYTLDAFGNQKQTDIYDPLLKHVYTRSGQYDHLGRELIETAGEAQTVTRSYDPNGNVETSTDGQTNRTVNTFDALNRLSSVQDAKGGITKTNYDVHDHVTLIQDANKNETSYTRNGFGDVIQLLSPDSGKTVYYCDDDSNVIQKTDARGIVVKHDFDKNNRVKATTYPTDPAENVTFTYDENDTSHGFGVGRLTTVTDAAGTVKRRYDERGHLLNEARVNGTVTSNTSYTYNDAGRTASITYPDTTVVSYVRDKAGKVSDVRVQLPGTASAVTLASLTHHAFGPIDSVKFGNNVSETWTFDSSYRAHSIVDTLNGNDIQNLGYGYDLADNVKTIADGVNPANSQMFTYDELNELHTASSGSSGYGTFEWKYDAVRNRISETHGSTTTTYGYVSGSNRLLSITPTTTKTQLRRVVPQIFQQIKRTPDWAHAPPIPQAPSHPNITRASADPTSPGSASFDWILASASFLILAALRKRKSSRALIILSIVVLLSISVGVTISGCGSQSSVTLQPPTFSPPGGIYSAAQTVTITGHLVALGTSVVPNKTVYYTTDGTTPTTSSLRYASPITVSATTTLSAVTTASGYASSAIAQATYTINLPATSIPVFSPSGGNYNAAQSVMITDGTVGASIYFTTDGTSPTTSSPRYSSPINVASSETLKAIALAPGYSTSAVSTASYAITTPVATAPSFSLTGDSYSVPQTLVITDATPTATIFYTIDGSAPTPSSTKYTAPITVASSETVSAIAVAPGYTNSSVTSASFTINQPQAAAPVFSPIPGSFASPQTVTITDATPAASIYVTTDGSTPSVTSTPYSSPLTVASTETIKAIATAPSYTTSNIATGTYTISPIDLTKVVTNDNGNITGIVSGDGTSYLTFTYNDANRPGSVSGGPLAAAFVYDWEGQRYSKTNGGLPPTLYSYSQDQEIIAENEGGTVTDYVYVDGRPLALLQPSAASSLNQVRYLHTDRLGTPQLVTDGSGSSVWSTTYQPFGTTGTLTSSVMQNLRFPGQIADVETGFYYNVNRDYIPHVGRYLETDLIGLLGGHNTFTYGNGNPTRRIDPVGLEDTDYPRLGCPSHTKLVCTPHVDPITPDPTLTGVGHQAAYNFGGLGYAPKWPWDENSVIVKWGGYDCLYDGGGQCAFIAPGTEEDYYGSSITQAGGRKVPDCPQIFVVDPDNPDPGIDPAFYDAITHNYQCVPIGNGACRTREQLH